MAHEVRDYRHLLGRLDGFSDEQLLAHFELYEAYARKLNEVDSKLVECPRAGANYSYGLISELHRRRAVAHNGAILHECYFESLTDRATHPEDELLTTLLRSFGSLEAWAADARAILNSGPGWMLLTRSRNDGALKNWFVEEHHRGAPVEHDLLLALDGWEHAYMIDFGVAKDAYLKVLEAAIDWDAVTRRFVRSLDATRSWLAGGVAA